MSQDLHPSSESERSILTHVTVDRLPTGSHVIMDEDHVPFLSDEISIHKAARARVLVQHDHWLYVRDEGGCEGFVPAKSCHPEAQISIEVTQAPCSSSNIPADPSRTAPTPLRVPRTISTGEGEEIAHHSVPDHRGSSFCDSGYPSDSEYSDSLNPLQRWASRGDGAEQMGELDSLLAQLCSQGKFFDTAQLLDNKQLTVRRCSAAYIAERKEEVSVEPSHLLIELGTVASSALVCTERGEKGYLPINFLLQSTHKVACFSVENTSFHCQSMENVQTDSKTEEGGSVGRIFPPRPPCASASSLYDIKHKEVKDLKNAVPQIHRSYKLKIPEKLNRRVGRFSKIRNFTIGTPREGRLKVFTKHLCSYTALLVTESYTVGVGSRQFTIKKGETLITQDQHIATKTWIWVHTMGSHKWQGFVPRSHVHKMSSV